MKQISEKVVRVVEPCLVRLRQAVEQSGRFKLNKCGVVRDGPSVFTVGISCTPSEAHLTDVSLSFACVGFTTPDAPYAQFTASVGWHRSSIAGEHQGFSIYEANAGPFRFTADADIQGLIGELPRMEAAMRRALRRGHPPSRMTMVWRRLLHRFNRG